MSELRRNNARAVGLPSRFLMPSLGVLALVATPAARFAVAAVACGEGIGCFWFRLMVYKFGVTNGAKLSPD